MSSDSDVLKIWPFWRKRTSKQPGCNLCIFSTCTVQKELAQVAKSLLLPLNSSGPCTLTGRSIIARPLLVINQGFPTRRHKMSIAPHRHCRQMLLGVWANISGECHGSVVLGKKAIHRLIVYLFLAAILMKAFGSSFAIERLACWLSICHIFLPRRISVWCPRTSSVPH